MITPEAPSHWNSNESEAWQSGYEVGYTSLNDQLSTALKLVANTKVKQHELFQENLKLRRIIRHALLFTLDHVQNDSRLQANLPLTETPRLTFEEQRQLGRDLATYGQVEADV